MRRTRIVLGMALVAVAFAPVIFIVGSAVAAAVANGPENVTVTAGQALAAGAEAAQKLKAKDFTGAIGPLLLVLGFLLKHPMTGGLFAKIPARWRALAMLAGGGATTAAGMIAAGTPIFEALIAGFQAGTSATGCYEIWQGITTTPLKELLQQALKIADPKAREDAVTKLANE